MATDHTGESGQVQPTDQTEQIGPPAGAAEGAAVPTLPGTAATRRHDRLAHYRGARQPPGVVTEAQRQAAQQHLDGRSARLATFAAALEASLAGALPDEQRVRLEAQLVQTRHALHTAARRHLPPAPAAALVGSR